jgi:uncharacterized membrane protein/ribosomal protein S27AE
MSIESGRKFGFYASLINVILPIVCIIGGVIFIFSIIFAATSGIANGTSIPAFSAAFGGFIFNFFIIAISTIAIAGFVMFMYAMYSLSNYYNEPAIFKNVLYAFILSIVSGIVVLVLVFVVLISTFLGFSSANPPSSATPVFMEIILTYAVVFVVALAFGIINGLLYMRAFNKLKEKSGVDDFGTAGLLFLIGVFIPIIMWITWIFALMGFNKLKAAPTTLPNFSYYSQPPLSSVMQTKRCPNCGTGNRADAIFCGNCGKPL